MIRYEFICPNCDVRSRIAILDEIYSDSIFVCCPYCGLIQAISKEQQKSNNEKEDDKFSRIIALLEKIDERVNREPTPDELQRMVHDALRCVNSFPMPRWAVEFTAEIREILKGKNEQ